MEKFEGFPPEKQTWNFPTVINGWIHKLSGAEFKVLWYIVRHTYGWQKNEDAISYRQFMEGIQRKDGIWVDRGTGLKRRAIAYSLKRLEEMGFIERISGSETGKVGIYKLKFANQTRAKMKLPPCKNETPPVQKGNSQYITRQSITRQSLSPLPSLSSETSQTALSSDMRERLFSRFRNTFSRFKFSEGFLEANAAKIDYLLFLIEKGEIKPQDIRSPRAYLKSMNIEDTFPGFEKREEKKLRAEAKEKREDCERKNIDPEKGKQNIKSILEMLEKKETSKKKSP